MERCPAANRHVAEYGRGGALRKQPPRDAQHAGVRGEARARKGRVRPHPSPSLIKKTHKQACPCRLLLRRTRYLAARPPSQRPLRSFQPTHRFARSWHRHRIRMGRLVVGSERSRPEPRSKNSAMHHGRQHHPSAVV
jgi:hypothetical protein